MNRTLSDQLKDWKKHNVPAQPQRKNNKKKPEKKNKENLSDGDLRYLMGTNMRTLRRGKGGAYK